MFCRGRILYVAAFSAALSSAVFAETPATRTMSLSDAHVDVVSGGRVVISMEVEGDIRGLLTLTLDRASDGTQITGGTWAFVARYVEYMTEGGEVVHKDDPPPPNGQEVGPNVRYVDLGGLSGGVDGGYFSVGDDGALTGVGSVLLTVGSGSGTFDGSTGTGLGTVSAINDRQASTGSFMLTF